MTVRIADHHSRRHLNKQSHLNNPDNLPDTLLQTCGIRDLLEMEIIDETGIICYIRPVMTAESQFRQCPQCLKPTMGRRVTEWYNRNRQGEGSQYPLTFAVIADNDQ